jgi:ethanolamine utilization protein EutA
VITFSGGVAEYVFDRESVGYGDLGAALGAQLRSGVPNLATRIVDLGTGIRATVAGTSQSSVQVSGNTVAASAGSWPLRNVAVLDPLLDLRGDVSAAEVATAITRSVRARDLPADEPFALSFRWRGAPSFGRLHAFAEGVHRALRGRSTPTVIMLDQDLGASVGGILREEFGHTSGLVCLDNLELEPLDYVDIGSRIEPAGVFPVVIKSLLFHAEAATLPEGDRDRAAQGDNHE